MKVLIKLNTGYLSVLNFVTRMQKHDMNKTIRYNSLETVCTWECVLIEFRNTLDFEEFKIKFEKEIENKRIEKIIKFKL